MVEKIAVENGKISNFKGLVTLTLDRVILHTVVESLAIVRHCLHDPAILVEHRAVTDRQQRDRRTQDDSKYCTSIPQCK